MRCETVIVNRDGEPVIINKSDFVEGKDKLFSDKPEKPTKQRKSK